MGRQRLSPGAPPSTRLRTPRLGVLARENGLFEQLLVAFDTNLMVVNFDHIDKRPEVRLPKGHRSGAEVLTDGTPETRRLSFWATGMQLSANLLEGIELDNGRNRDLDDFVISLSLACF